LINEHTHIATDSADALWQIRKSILYPQRMKQLKHAKLLETIILQIKLSKNTIHVFKVKAHAGILGNEEAGAIAKCSAEIKVAMTSILTRTPIATHPASGQQRWETLPQLPIRCS
jgi:ribonuclease HI